MPRQAGTASVKAPKFRKEAELLDAMRRQDPDAMRELMDRYRRYVYTVIANVLTSSGTAADAEELTADTFYAVWRHADVIEPGKLKAYLAVTARNQAKSFLRKRRMLPMDLDMLPLSDGISLEDLAIAQELKALLRKAIDKMRPQDRDIFLRYYYYMQTTQEIASLLGIPHSTVRSRLARGRKTLKKLLTKEGFS